jgi:hypothetical protein
MKENKTEEQPTPNGEYKKSWWGSGIFNNVNWGSIYKPKQDED